MLTSQKTVYGKNGWTPHNAFTAITEAVLPDEYGITKLMYAVVNGDLENVKTLIQNGANVNYQTPNRYSFIETGSCKYTLIDRGERRKILKRNGSEKYEMVYHRVAGKDSNCDDAKSMSPILIAADLGQTEILKYLILNGADVLH